MVLTKKQRFGKFIKWEKSNKLTLKIELIIYNDQINLKHIDARLLKVGKKDYKEIDIYYIGYVTVKKIANCNNIDSVKPLYWMIKEIIVTRRKRVPKKKISRIGSV